MVEKITLKESLYHLCEGYAEQRLAAIQRAIEAAREAANNETKSTAGDKYETTRAMMQFEQEKLATQLAEVRRLQQQLRRIDFRQLHDAVRPGSVVKTSQGNFYLAIGAGKLNAGEEEYMAVSAASPLGTRLNGLAPGANITLNGKDYLINDVF